MRHDIAPGVRSPQRLGCRAHVGERRRCIVNIYFTCSPCTLTEASSSSSCSWPPAAVNLLNLVFLPQTLHCYALLLRPHPNPPKISARENDVCLAAKVQEIITAKLPESTSGSYKWLAPLMHNHMLSAEVFALTWSKVKGLADDTNAIFMKCNMTHRGAPHASRRRDFTKSESFTQ